MNRDCQAHSFSARKLPRKEPPHNPRSDLQTEGRILQLSCSLGRMNVSC